MKIFAVGMNYLEHNKELHGSLFKPEEPVIFTKADSAVLKDHKPFFIPDHMGRIDYETEIVVRISKLGKNISERFAHRYYDAVTVGIDFTARELQKKLRAEGKPWDLCKGFDGSAALGEWVSLDKFRDIQALHFHLDISVIEVLYPAGKPQLVCFVLGIIPEANTLYASVKYDMFSDDICHVVLHLYVFFLLAFLLQNQ